MGGYISIHALLAESDAHFASQIHSVGISIHALLAESDQRGPGIPDFGVVFLSTLSLRRATPEGVGKRQPAQISIHALLAESDRMEHSSTCTRRRFLSTLSLRRATAGGRSGCLLTMISIHALLAESDQPYQFGHPYTKNFYPRSPCGERRCMHRWYSR